MGALQRFHDQHGRPPRAKECRLTQGLPSTATLAKKFGSFSVALQAAGMAAPTVGMRRQRWTAIEAAKACWSFRWRHNRWPDAIDVQRSPGVLPGRNVMIRFFGSTHAAEVQLGVESISSTAG